MLKTKNYFSSNFSLHRRLLSWKKNFEWFGKNYQRGCAGKMIKIIFFSRKNFWGKIFYVKVFLSDNALSGGTEDLKIKKMMFSGVFFSQIIIFTKKLLRGWVYCINGIHRIDDQFKKLNSGKKTCFFMINFFE